MTLSHFICSACKIMKAIAEADWIVDGGFLCRECRQSEIKRETK